MLLSQAQEVAHAAAEAAYGTFEPLGAGWIALLPLLGFVINGALALIASLSRRTVPPPTHAVGEPSEEELHADEHAPHPATPPHTEPTGKPWTHLLPSFVAPGVVGLAFVLAVVNFFRMVEGHPEAPEIVTFWSWMPVGELQIDAAFHLDQLSLLMTLIVTGVGFLIHIFSVGYMREDPGYPRYMAYLNLFVFFMLVLVLGASYPLMFVGWEGVGLCSYLLIGFWWAEKANADAGKKAFIVNRIGDFGFLIAMFLLFVNLGTLNFVEVFEAAPVRFEYGGIVVTTIALFFFLGATGKSAQIPLHVWLPDAMAGPTPVSALIHAATMVTAGVYLIVRSSALYTLAPVASLVVALVGALTAIFAATIGLKQWDIKKVLAYSTVSQLGFMFAAVGMGAYVAGMFHLMTHAFFKALLFLGSGAVIHTMHHALHVTHNPADAQDIRNMGGLRHALPITFWTMAIATLAIAGVPPFAGFFSKDEIVGAAWIGAGGDLPMAQGLALLGYNPAFWFGLIGVILSVAALLTAIYMGRMMIYTFFGPNRTGEEERRHLHEVGWTMTVPLIALAILSVIGGWFNIDYKIPIVNWFTPVAIGGVQALHDWLHPTLVGTEEIVRAQFGELADPPHAAWPIVLAIVIGAGGLLFAWFFLRPERLRPAGVEPDYESAPEKVLYHKWYVDELYDAIVVRPVVALSRGFSRIVDKGIIDGVVDGAGRLAQSFGLIIGRLQSGLLNTYALTIVIGVLVVLGAFVAL